MPYPTYTIVVLALYPIVVSETLYNIHPFTVKAFVSSAYGGEGWTN